jgi:hypothetical protein
MAAVTAGASTASRALYGVCNIHRRTAGAKGFLQVERNERFIFDDENVLASEHASASVAELAFNASASLF